MEGLTAIPVLIIVCLLLFMGLLLFLMPYFVYKISNQVVILNDQVTNGIELLSDISDKLQPRS
jgi:hypothetical protein